MTTEKQFQQQVLELAGLYGWRAYHTFDSRRSAAGFPDLVLGRPPRLIFAELKTATGRVSAAQQAWLDDLTAVANAIGRCWDDPSPPAVAVFIWRPDDLQRIANVLAAGRVEPSGVQAVTPLGGHHQRLGGGRAA
jgi:hypothetical protein